MLKATRQPNKRYWAMSKNEKPPLLSLDYKRARCMSKLNTSCICFGDSRQANEWSARKQTEAFYTLVAMSNLYKTYPG